MGCIYRILNKVNGKSYIGQTVYDCPKRRWNVHKNNCKNEKYQQYIYRAIRKDGLENFEFTVIYKCETNLLSELESKYISEFNTFGEGGYNMTSGGEGRRGYKLSEETKQKISLAGKKRVTSEETRKKLAIASTGRVYSQETREKLRKAATKAIKKSETVQKIKVPKERVIKDSTREKLRNNMLGKPKSSEHVLNIRKAKRVLSDEDVKYIRENPDKLQGKELAIKFNSSRASISRIINNKRYI